MKSSIVFGFQLSSIHRDTSRFLFTRRRACLLLLFLTISGVTLWLGANRAQMAAFQSTIPVGTGAGCPAVNAVTNKIYVANAGSNNVTVINGADHSTATVAVGTFPSAIAINAVTNKIYVANTNSNDVTVINGADNSTTTVPVGSNPKGLVANPVTNKVYVTNSLSNTVTIIDGADNSTATVAVGSAPFAVAVNAVTNKVYVANCGQFCGGSGNGDVTVIDGADNSTAAVTAGIHNTVIVVNPATNKIYVASLGSNFVTVINGADNSTASIAFVPDGHGFGFALNPITNKGYVLSGSSVRVINTANDTQETVLLCNVTPTSIAINPMTNKIYVAECQSHADVTVIDGANNSMTTVTTGFDPGAVAVNPVTNKVYVTPADNTPSMAVIDGADYARVTIPAGSRPVDVALNPVTNKIYVANCGDCVFASSGGTGIGDVTVINGSDNSTATVTAGTNPLAVAVNPVTNKTYVANYGSNNVTVINGADNSTATVTAGTSPIAIAVNPITNKIYVVNNGSATVTIINGADNSTVTISAGTTPFSAATNFLSGTGHYAIAVNQITNRIYVGNKSGANVMVINGADNSTATVAVGSQPAALAVNTATNKVYVANEGSNNVTVIDAADNTTVTVPAGSLPWAVAVNPLTNKIYVGGSFMTVINGQDNTTTTISGGNDVGISVNPATNKLYVANLAFKPRVINAADNSMQTLNTLQFGPIAVAVNAVTNKSYFVNNQSDNVNVYTEQNVQTIPLTVSITPQAFQPDSPSRTFNFTASSTFSPTAPPVQQIHYQVDTWINTWMTATPAGSNTQSSVAVGPLADGFNIMYAYATDGRDGSTSTPPIFATSGVSPMIGQIQAFVFFVNSTAPPPPTMSAAGPLSPQQGSPVINLTIANVDDPASGAGGVTVTVTSANPSNGVTISNIVNNAGTITADVIADCTATNASFSLRATDANGWVDATLDVTVIANTSPTLSYNNVSLVSGGSITINSATGPSDNGTFESIVLQSPGAYTGNVSVNNTTGVVLISNAAPVGTHTITIRATDNCGATTDSQLTLTVTDLPNNCTAVAANGNWSDAATWGCGHLPTANDAVVIQPGRNIILDVDPSAFSISVNFAGTLTVSGDHTLPTNLNVNGTLSFGSFGSQARYSSPSASVVGSNKLITANNLVSLSCTGVVSGASSSGYVIGNVKKVYCAAGAFSYPTGTANGYSPVDVNVTSLATNPASLAVTAVEGVQPALASQASTSLHRYWTLTGAGLTTDLTFNYLVGDVMGIEAAYKVIRVSGGTPVVFPASTVNTTNHQGTLTGVNSFSDWTLGQVTAPTASESTISGQIIERNGNPVEGAGVRLTGTQDRLTATDAQGNYRFDNVETNGFYTVTPSRVNYNFSPTQRSFSQLGQNTDAIFNATSTGATSNPLDTTEYFVRQQYIDFLGREPDEPGFNFWVNNIENCGDDANCRAVKRTDTSAAFFHSLEFQQTGYLVYRTYQAAYGDLPGAPVPISLNEFNPDTQAIRRNVVVNQNGWQDRLEENKRAFVEEFVQRARFTNLYASMNDGQFVDTLNQNAGFVLSQAERDQLVSDISTNAKTRAQVLRSLAENGQLAELEFNHAFVLMQYFGYLCRDANAAPDTDFSGYNFWLSKLNTFGGDFRDAEMVKGFLLSGEYRQRFPR